MTSFKELKDQRRQFSCHFTWNLEYKSHCKSMKQFQSLMNLINVHIAESPAMIIEGRLFKSYLFFSDFKGNVEKKTSAVIESLNEVHSILKDDPREASFKDGYLLIALALEAWLDRDKTKLEAKISTLKKLQSKYETGSPNRNKFLGSIHATKGFAFSRLGMIRYPESIEQFQIAVDLCPNEKDWLFSLGLIIWRTGVQSVGTDKICPDMKKAVTMFYDVLKIDHDHSYAMTLIAELKRRQNLNTKAEYFLQRALNANPTHQKTIGEVAKVYRKMGKSDKALTILRAAAGMPKTSSFIYHQLHVVYRDMNIQPSVDYLQKAIDENPSNLAAKFDRAKDYISQKRYDRAREYYDDILANCENDPLVVIQTNFHYAKFLAKINELDGASEKNQEILDVALEECKENSDPPFYFFKEIDWMVRKSIEKLRRHFECKIKADKNDKGSFLKLAMLEKKLGNHGKACQHYEQIIHMQPPIDTGLRWTIVNYLADIKIRKNLFTDVDPIIEDMEQLNLKNPNPDILQKCKANLAVEKGKFAFQKGKKDDALEFLVKSVKHGSLEGAGLLFDEVKTMDRGNGDFYTHCAHIYCCLEKNGDGDKRQLKEDLDLLLSGDTSRTGTVLFDLRNTQLNLEMCYIVGDEKLAVFRDQIINKSRTILNQTMAKFRNRHYGHVSKSCDFFNIPKCSSAKIKKKVRYRLQTDYEWDEFEIRFPDLFNFLVSIQPASNPPDNNWMFAWLKMDNEYKHASGLGDKLNVKVYSDNLGNMVEQEFTTLVVARKVCDNIGTILNEFLKYF